ncbi:hypothetical protein BC938DRAFT_477941 [Jimgerdemannia flammicorona]|uniref:AIG1-type G domain-containing protein n=1 Tax=Jimgerdemannia flammicorona TaxID=994334 RepID=A0A433P7A1_9FUNG|nr:hypothetical protein BC938DRAFT_477941 [Jimgerdemannia flammicorona]
MTSEAGRFTKEQEAVIVEIKDFLGDESVSHMILAFSKCDKKQTIGNDLKFNEKLRQLVRETGDRWVISPDPEKFDPDSNTFMQQIHRLKYLIAGMKMPYTIALFNRVRIARETELARQREERKREEQRIEQAKTQKLREEAEAAIRKQLEEENAHSKEELRRVEMEYAARMEEIQNRKRQADLEHATAMTALNERLDQAVRSAADLRRHPCVFL